MASKPPVRLPEMMSRSEVGAYLRDLRGHFAMSEQDVCDHLHIRVRYLQAIETGDYSQLPGAVYARGYVHQYAGFLGVDAAQVVEMCFGADAQREIVSASAMPKAIGSHSPVWRSGVALALIAAIGMLIFAQLARHRMHSAQPEMVEAVPDSVLAAIRTMMMPTPANIDCLQGDEWSACLRSTREWQMLTALENPPPRYAASAGLAPAMADDADEVEVDAPVKADAVVKPNAIKPDAAIKTDAVKSDAAAKTDAPEDKPVAKAESVKKKSDKTKHAVAVKPKKAAVKPVKDHPHPRDSGSAEVDHNALPEGQ